MTLLIKLTGRRIAKLQTTARARYMGDTNESVKQAQAMSLLVEHSIPAAKRVLIYTVDGKMTGEPSKRGLELMALGKWWRERRAEPTVRPQPVGDDLAKRKEALLKMRTLWNGSGAAAEHTAGEDGVDYQKRLRAEW